MTNFKDLDIKTVYRTGDDDIYRDFYSKVLNESISYDRAVGFFSSHILSMNTRGLSHLVKNNGRMRLIIGKPLDQDEYDAINQGHDLKEKLLADLSNQLVQMLTNSEDNDKFNRLTLLVYLIACNRLEIKFALRRQGMYHEKIGILKDNNNNIIVFQGSANETPHGLMGLYNAESICVYKSWDEHIFENYGKYYIEGFERLWNNQQKDTLVLSIPSNEYNSIANSIKSTSLDINTVIQDEDFYEKFTSIQQKREPIIPTKIGDNEFNIYEHQRKTLMKWKANHYKGIFELATGSGKTITAIYGAVKVYQSRREKSSNTVMCMIISVPYIELAKQWVENLKFFNIFPIECYGSKSQWINTLKYQISYLNNNIKPFIAIIVVNKTLVSDNFQRLIKKIHSKNILFIGDECHHHGSKNINEALIPAKYRMGLSATPFRYENEEFDNPFTNQDKERLENYYGRIVATYSLSDAINDKVLSPYNYYIIPVYLTFYEQEKYDELSTEIGKIIAKQKHGKLNQSDKEHLTTLCGQRIRILGSASNKFAKLYNITKNINSKEKKHTLFYAGEGKVFNDEPLKEDESVIKRISEILKNNGWKLSRFTSSLSKKDRTTILQAFKEESIDALVAMKVLDEGIDVPACKNAYILASTRNPRQYIQRRGRILRKSEGKDYANIYDFVVLPNDYSGSENSSSLVKSELERVNDFILLASNKFEAEQQLKEYGLNL